MIQQQVDLRRFNTFGLPAVAERFLALTDEAQLTDPLFRQAPDLVLGGGSNLLLMDELPGLTVHVQLSGVTWADGKGRYRVAAGTDWNQFVRYTLEQGHSGMENLILIPGTVGASPVQNIGAYGSEVAEFITTVHAWEYGVGAVDLSPADCAFGYRDSRFKREPGRYLITAVSFDLSEPRALKLDYGAIRTELELRQIDQPTASDVAAAVTAIRRSKLPDWFFLGNSGSFFKNPVVPRPQYEALHEQYTDLPAYPIDDTSVKLPAGWLIDRAGLRGTGTPRVGTYARQALVLVNRGGATGRDVLAFSTQVQETVAARFGVQLEREVQLIGRCD
ncbi:UDP-N-acetylenolpyruvoylglucosamine reductase [Neolewinella maritima]|uniref:UDP-N-acetylenolpyruvoylglucosamine reductase n=1 Tax=Neolewinella maritima TaxID=1383882 RepID=A0ABM9AYP7_9BACT|nr:UDP-N-acetylmuramate dehydrogenase [Neolewinella maritima]CAH0999428.1 UDP-N-acetylenolpyruvoylglucosamine reductase [Neolewinella maritima]